MSTTNDEADEHQHPCGNCGMLLPVPMTIDYVVSGLYRQVRVAAIVVKLRADQ